MASKGPGTRRLVLCGVCFLADCPWSKWIDDDGGEEVAEFLDIMRQEYFERLHEELVASQLTVDEKRERIAATIQEVQEQYGVEVEITNLETLLQSSAKLSETRAVIQKDISPMDLLQHMPNEAERNKEQQK